MKQLVNHANTIYENSEVKLRLEVRCVTLWIGFTETENSSGMLSQLRSAGGMKINAFNLWNICKPKSLFPGSDAGTRNSADIALLIISGARGGNCGIAYTNGYQHRVRTI